MVKVQAGIYMQGHIRDTALRFRPSRPKSQHAPTDPHSRRLKIHNFLRRIPQLKNQREAARSVEVAKWPAAKAASLVLDHPKRTKVAWPLF